MQALEALATSETRFLPIFLGTSRKTGRNRVSSPLDGSGRTHLNFMLTESGILENNY